MAIPVHSHHQGQAWWAVLLEPCTTQGSKRTPSGLYLPKHHSHLGNIPSELVQRRIEERNERETGKWT